MEPEEPVVLNGRYELRELIGRGGMAEVHRAFDRVLSRHVAVKVMHTALLGAAERQRFAAETRVLAQMNDPHLVTIWDAGVDEAERPPRPWLVMELLTGSTLAARVASGPLAPAEVATLGAGLAAGLAHVHSHGVVHRDVKPANVLFNDAGVAKLADFGIARMTGDRGELTQTGHTIGTAAYLAPEQVRNETLTGASDVYALGLVLLEALTGHRAYSGTAIEAAVERLHHGPAIPVSLGSRWIRILEEMTAQNPHDRPPAALVADRLTALTTSAITGRPTRTGPAASMTAGSPTDAATESIAMTEGPWLPRRARLASRSRTAAAAAVLVIAGIGLWAALASGSSGGPATTAADAAATTAPRHTSPSTPSSTSPSRPPSHPPTPSEHHQQPKPTPTSPTQAVPVIASTHKPAAPTLHQAHATPGARHHRPRHSAKHHSTHHQHKKHHHKKHHHNKHRHPQHHRRR